MEETKFMKVYHHVLLPFYLLVGILWLWYYLHLYGMHDTSVSTLYNVIMILLGIAHFAYIALVIYLLIAFRRKTRVLYFMNMTFLYAFPFIYELSLITTQMVIEPAKATDFLSDAWVYSIGYYLILYIIQFIIFFLPQVIYFENRKWLFTQRTEQ